MGLFGALFSGLSGLEVYSSSIEVIGNNIANANTAGFKTSRAEFSEILARSLSGSVSGNQIGRGVQLSSVSTQFTQGPFESTSSGTDLAIDGQGFFIVRNSDGIFYTRAGQFVLDGNGTLVNARGDRVQGVILDTSGNPAGTLQDLNLSVTNSPLLGISVNRDGIVTGQFTNGQTRDLARLVLANFNAPARLSTQGNSLFAETQESGQPILGQPTTAGFGSVIANSVELSNVDIAEQFVNLIAEQQAFQANARVISASEDLLDEIVNLTR